MLRRVENVQVEYKPRLFRRKGWVLLQVGRREYRVGTTPRAEFARLTEVQRGYPVLCGVVGERQYWRFADRFFWDNDWLTSDQVHALLVTRGQRDAERIDRAQAMVAMGAQPRQSFRQVIAPDVKQDVWMRDGGRCTHCGSDVELQFDHVIPVAMGGGSAPDNL